MERTLFLFIGDLRHPRSGTIYYYRNKSFYCQNDL